MSNIGDSCYVCLPYLKDDSKFVSGLEGIFDEVVFQEGERPGKEELKSIAKKYEVAIIGTKESMDEEVAEAVEILKTIGTLSAGLDHINVEEFEGQGVDVFNVSQSNSVSVAEHTLSLTLASQKRLLESQKSVLEGKYREGIKERPTELRNKTVGIIGAGSIAKEVIDRLRCFGVNIRVWTFNPDKHTEIEDETVKLVNNLEKLIEKSDVVTVHIPLSDKTESLINSEILSKVDEERHRILINTSRADIVEKSVLESLGKNSVFNSAGLDVYPDNLPENSNERILFTPHTAGLTQESSRRMRNELISQISSKHR